MREILFRGKRVDTGEWVSGRSLLTVLQDNNYLYYIPQQGEDFKANPSIDNDRILSELFGNFYQVDPKTVGQYTGLTDKNGNKIFEGDILEQDVVQSGTPHREFVEWDYDLFGNRHDEWSAFFEIIGNIHDNPDARIGKKNIEKTK